jgi:hypothetical protein
MIERKVYSESSRPLVAAWKQQAQKDAVYYSRRRLFYHRRDKADLACQYLREAHHQDCNDGQIRESYAKALVALRRAQKCPLPEDHLERGELASLTSYS